MAKSYRQVSAGGTIFWVNDEDELHREDGPALESSDGSRSWYINGVYRREDGPAIEMSSGKKMWYINGKLHRLDGPAIIHSDSMKEWYQNNELHRLGGPAIEYPDGHGSWLVSGTRVDSRARVDFATIINHIREKLR